MAIGTFKRGWKVSANEHCGTPTIHSEKLEKNSADSVSKLLLALFLKVSSMPDSSTQPVTRLKLNWQKPTSYRGEKHWNAIFTDEVFWVVRDKTGNCQPHFTGGFGQGGPPLPIRRNMPEAKRVCETRAYTFLLERLAQ